MNPDDISTITISTITDTLIKEYGSIKAVARKPRISERTVRKYRGYKAVPEEIKEKKYLMI